MQLMRCEIYKDDQINNNSYMTHYVPINILPRELDVIELYNRDNGEIYSMEVVATILGFMEDEIYMKIYVI